MKTSVVKRIMVLGSIGNHWQLELGERERERERERSV